MILSRMWMNKKRHEPFQTAKWATSCTDSGPASIRSALHIGRPSSIGSVVCLGFSNPILTNRTRTIKPYNNSITPPNPNQLPLSVSHLHPFPFHLNHKFVTALFIPKLVTRVPSVKPYILFLYPNFVEPLIYRHCLIFIWKCKQAVHIWTV